MIYTFLDVSNSATRFVSIKKICLFGLDNVMACLKCGGEVQCTFM